MRQQQARNQRSEGSNRGFAAMDREEQRRIASMGGRASHGGRGRDYEDDQDYEEEDLGNREDRDYGSSRRGFAAMDPQEQRRIAAEGGRASHGGWGRDYEEDDQDYEEDASSRGNHNRGSGERGFAAMDPQQQRRIAAMGGRASHSGSHSRTTSRGRKSSSGSRSRSR
jgi:general stress protein YciG